MTFFVTFFFSNGYPLGLVFNMSGKCQTIGDFTFVPTIPDFADISDIRQRSVPYFQEMLRLFVIGVLEHSN